MDPSFIRVVAAGADVAREDADKLVNEAARSGASVQVTQALLAASWSLRSATFALRLAAQMVDSPGESPKPSENRNQR